MARIVLVDTCTTLRTRESFTWEPVQTWIAKQLETIEVRQDHRLSGCFQGVSDTSWVANSKSREW